MKKYYIISLKWTYPNSAAFTLWGENDKGYCWRKEQAGLYTESEIIKYKEYYNNKKYTIAIEDSLIENLWVKAEYDNKISMFLLNNEMTRQHIGITKKQLLGGMSDIKENELNFLVK
jgi:hypothetical protein